ncbi:diguanylate cyclase (GGDEF)-like protein [Natronospira proteinivora]|uniref:Diguanylate cyclase (GGDEF)-like protein n=1 Tax=Natronospira proteinivora TaxID=1807133 RepID=A0ABT1G4Z0_9GAMM|nr:EAL domain-containing protein [Natronospira proteinivora]MCP1726346.1 diguanylate cyclase (GGDEF)-like protein [Natronospira proteinivora]
MTAPPAPTRAPPLITIGLVNAANAQLLERLLGNDYDSHRGLEGDGNQFENCELIIVDGFSLNHHRDQIKTLRAQTNHPFLPVLLVTDNRAGPNSRITAELGDTVDDILRIPTSRAELLARIDNLLRLGRLSREQEASRKQLSSVVNALSTLNACDSIVVRAQSEDELLQTLCQTIIDEEGYRLAWIGFVHQDKGCPVRIRASAGPATGFVEALESSWRKNSANQSSVLRTIRSGTTAVIHDIAMEPASAARDHALTHGLGAAITLSLKPTTGPTGCLTIYSATPRPFSVEERQLLSRLADNLVFGINTLRMRQEREAQATEIHSLAYTDALTGLPNRRHLLDFLDKALSRNQTEETQAAVLFIDMDGFKLINDALGHDVGDEVIIQIGQRLQTSVRDSDLVVRQGGDEFIVVMLNEPRRGEVDDGETFLENVHILVERIITHLNEPLTAGGHSHRLGASVGISLCPDHGHHAATLIENADKAMFAAKERKDNRGHLFSEDITEKRHRRLSMEARLRQALEHQKFTLHYQPIFELASLRIVSTEALIRWPQEDGELLMPGSFMPLMEETGLIRPLGDWVLETAARQLQAWQDQGMPLWMAINLSLNQLYPHGDTEALAKRVKPFVHPSHIHLEVTENALMREPQVIEGLLTELNGHGFRLAIDDFGTGYSSLSRLQHLPIHTLKIDRSFVNEICHTHTKGAVLAPIIQKMATSLSLETIAEGIETDQQRKHLQDLGVQWGQGFWFSKAIPAEEFQSLYKPQQDR